MLSNHSNMIAEKDTLIDVNYWLAELPIFTSDSVIFNEKSTIFCYHNNPQFIQRLFKESLFDLVNDENGLATVTFQ